MLHSHEIQAKEIKLVGKSDETYPLQKKYHRMEFLRENTQIRYRSKSGMMVMKIRDECITSIHEYLHKYGFYNVQCPILTSNDCEGAGEAFEYKYINLNLKIE